MIFSGSNQALKYNASIKILKIDEISFENIITGIHFNNKKDNQKLKHGGK